MRPSLVPFSVLVLAALAARPSPQAGARPQPYCVRGVALDRAGTQKATLVLRDGAIAAILDEAAPAPAGTRVIDGAGLICLPAFLDAYTRNGCTVPERQKDQDIPPNVQADVGIDMRLANRKGIQPGFRAVEALAITKEQAEAWRKNGFGAALVAPGGELLAGASALATTREAAMRDLVVRDEVFVHAAFAASGPGYPSTLMGYFAQLRQFLLDSQRHVDLRERYEEGRPGARPPFDAELASGAALVSRERSLVCEADDSHDVERWLRLADEFSLDVDFVGGREAWEVSERLAERDATVVLTLDWGKEPKDPREKDDEKGEKRGKDEGEDEEAEVEAKESKEGSPDADEATDESERTFEYEEPFAVRLERRARWERGRDCALRLHDAGVRFVFGSASGKPDELLGHVRTLVEVGLPADAALSALTEHAAEFLGVESRLGRIAVGQDATFTLWRADPLTDEDASAAWTFVDGFPSEFSAPEKKREGKRKKGEPAEGVDPSGTWELTFDSEGEGIDSATLELEMEADGAVAGTLEFANPMGEGRIEAEVEGRLVADQLELECTISLGGFEIQSTLTATVARDGTMEGESSATVPGASEPTTQSFRGKRGPK